MRIGSRILQGEKKAVGELLFEVSLFLVLEEAGPLLKSSGLGKSLTRLFKRTKEAQWFDTDINQVLPSLSKANAEGFAGKGVTVVFEGKNVPIYRGGNEFNIKPGEYRITPTGEYPARGPSLNADPAALTAFGEVRQIIWIPDELQIIFTPTKRNPMHYDIIPKDTNMSAEKFQELLNQIKTEPISF